ncbi:hypothetical protein ACOSQ3_004080 [Xanthoceras sorbifolium]
MTPRYLCQNKRGHYEQYAYMANDRLWECVSNEKLTRQHMLLFSCRPFSFSFIFNFLCFLSLVFSLKNQSTVRVFSGVFTPVFCLFCVYSGEAEVVLLFW